MYHPVLSSQNVLLLQVYFIFCKISCILPFHSAFWLWTQEKSSALKVHPAVQQLWGLPSCQEFGQYPTVCPIFFCRILTVAWKRWDWCFISIRSMKITMLINSKLSNWSLLFRETETKVNLTRIWLLSEFWEFSSPKRAIRTAGRS